MDLVDGFRDADLAADLARRIAATVTRPWVLMEVCGGQTHAIVRYGVYQLLPDDLELVHGPGCPVCVTALETIDRAHAIAARPEVVFTSFGDMLRVPGSRGDLLTLRSRGADVRVVYSPLDALRLAQAHPEREVVFFAIGFETTAPANAMAIFQAKQLGLRNFSVLAAHVLVPPAIAAILEAPDNRVQGFLGPGHVCAIVGTRDYEDLSRRYRVPIVISGFEPIDLLEGVLRCVELLEAGRVAVDNPYARAVHRDGNAAAQQVVADVFAVGDRSWRGIGTIPSSGLRIRDAYADFDAERRFAVDAIATHEAPECLSGEILRGRRKPAECPAFATVCTPQHPLGATMVSAEGACAAYYQHRRGEAAPPRDGNGH